MATAGPVARKHHRCGSSMTSQLLKAAWGPVSRALGRDNPAYGPKRSMAAWWHSVPDSGCRRGLLDRRDCPLRPADTLNHIASVAPTAAANRVVYRHGSLSEWYANGPLGVEHGFARDQRRWLGPPSSRSKPGVASAQITTIRADWCSIKAATGRWAARASIRARLRRTGRR